VIALSLEGDFLWMSIPLEGAAAGSPVISLDGRYVYLTHNSNAMSVGHFSVLDTLGATKDEGIFPLYSEFNVTNPFTPPGIFHKPEEGYYDGGQGNTNDIVLWGHAPNPADARVGNGASFVFQFPVNYVPNVAIARQADGGNDRGEDEDVPVPLYWYILGDNSKDWQAVSAPVITNYGRSLYWSVTRSQFRSWVGRAGSNSARFNRIKTNAPSFARGIPRYAPCPNTPALSSHPTQPMIFAGTASTQFVKMDYLMTQETAVIRNTTSMVRNRAIVSPDDQFVYFTEFSGVLHQASTVDLKDSWDISDIQAVDGEFALTSDGSMIIIGDVTGKVYFYRVAVKPTPEVTEEPTDETTTTAPEPSSSGVRPDTDVPVPVPGQPTQKPTQSPVFTPTMPYSDPRPTLPLDTSAGGRTTVILAWASVAAGCLLLV
jgi:hypothetical protein